MAGDIRGVLENKDKDSDTRQMCLCTGVLSNLNELILGMGLCAAIAPAVSSRFYCPERVFGTIKPSFMQQGINLVLLKVITLYRPNTRCISAVSNQLRPAVWVYQWPRARPYTEHETPEAPDVLH